MRLFTFNFKHALRIALFLFPLVAIVLPYEATIRAVESRYGQTTHFGSPSSDQQKLDWFLDILESGRSRFDTYIVGNSQCEYGLNPGVLRATLPSLGQIYDLAFSGSSFLAGLRILRRLQLYPSVVVACVSPSDFTASMVKRGNRLIEGASDKLANSDERWSYAEWHTAIDATIAHKFYYILRSLDPRYHRPLADFVRLATTPSAFPSTLEKAGRFLTTGRAGIKILGHGRYYIGYTDNGYMGLVMLRAWNVNDFKTMALEPEIRYHEAVVFPEYRADSSRFFAEAEALLKPLTAAGTKVIFVRMPQYRSLKALEDSKTSFVSDLKALSAEVDVPIIWSHQVASDIENEPSMFRDAVHLHEASSRVLTRRVATAMEQLLSGSMP